MVNELKLSGTKLNIFAIIYSFSQDGKSEFYGSRQYLSDFTGSSKPTIDRTLKDLIDENLIIKRQETTINGIENYYRYNADLPIFNELFDNKGLSNYDSRVYQNDKGGLSNCSRGVYQNDKGGFINLSTNNKDIYNKDSYNKDYNKKEIIIIDKSNDLITKEKDKKEIPYAEIIEYLNNKIGTRYLYTSRKTQDLIKARWNEGFRLNDFIVVIDKKVLEWYNDNKMKMYLRPETLFSNKFESYLNQLQRELTTKDLAPYIDYKKFMKGGGE
jgi:uncharacterized phage protein (TIGR02220 family)